MSTPKRPLTDEQVALELYKAFFEAPPSAQAFSLKWWEAKTDDGKGWWLAVARRARELFANKQPKRKGKAVTK